MFVKHVYGLALALVIAGGAAAQPVSDSGNIRIVSAFGQDTAVGRAVGNFSSAVNARIAGAVTSEIIPAENAKALQMLRSGDADVAVVSSSVADSALKASGLGLFDLPFLFRSIDEAASIQNSYIGDVILTSLSADHLVGLAYWNNGSTQLFGRRPVTAANDLKNARIRTTSLSAQRTLQALGAQTGSFSFAELSVALDNGSIDVAEISPALVVEGGFSPTYWTEANYRPLVAVVLMSEDRWQALSFRIQAALSDEARATVATVNADAQREEQIVKKVLLEKGFKPSVVSDDFTQEWVPAWRAGADSQTVKLLEATLPMLEELRPPQLQRRGDNVLGEQNSKVGVAIVLFGTDRKDEGGNDPTLRFGSSRASIQYGVAHFTIDPQRPIAGASNFATHLSQIDLLEEPRFREMLKQKLISSEAKDVTIYVHGYNTSFVDGAATAASLASDIAFQGVPILFSWPSDGKVLSYTRDGEQVRLSRDNLLGLLSSISDTEGVARSNLLAHSMGGRVVVDALELAKITSRFAGPPLRQLVLAAPDVNTDEFILKQDALKAAATRVTLYASEHDTALLCSRYVNDQRRAGLSGDEMVIVPHVDTVDVSPIEAPAPLAARRCMSSGGHSYVTRNSAVVGDLHAIVTFEAPPKRRFRLQQRQRDGVSSGSSGRE